MKNTQNASPIFKFIKFLAQIFSVFSIILSLLIAYDYFSPVQYNEKAIVTNKNETRGKGQRYHIKAEGKFLYNEPVSKEMYNLIENGDELHICLSKFFNKWKLIKIMKQGTVFTTNGIGMMYLGLFGILFLLTIFSFKRISFFQKYYFLLFGILAIEFLALILWVSIISRNFVSINLF